MDGKKRRTRSSDSYLPLEKGVDVGGRRVCSKPVRRKERVLGERDIEADSPSSTEPEDDDFGNFKVAVG